LRRAHKAALERGLADEQQPRDLGDGEAGDAAQRQRQPRARLQRRMAAGEQHRELVVVDGGAVEDRLQLVALLRRQQRRRVDPRRPLAPQPVERAMPGGRRQPRARRVGHPAATPFDRRGQQCLLDRVLGEREVAAEAPSDHREDRGTLGAEDAIEVGKLPHRNS
jgi:hypothetical protein